MKKNDNEGFQGELAVCLAVVFALAGVYFSIGYAAGWDVLLSDIAHKGRVAGASVAAVVRVFGPPSQPVVTATGTCSGGNPKISLSWASDENATEYDVYRDGSVIATGITDVLFPDMSVETGISYAYTVEARGPQGTFLSDPTTAIAPDCPLVVDPFVSVDVFHGKIVSSGNVPKTTERKPTFQGSTNIPSAKIDLELHSQQIIYATIDADENGHWQWRPTEELSYGTHALSVTASTPDDDSIIATVSFAFKISKKEKDDDADSTIRRPIAAEGSEAGTVKQPVNVLETPMTENPSAGFEIGLDGGSYVSGLNIDNEAYRGEDTEVSVVFSRGIPIGQTVHMSFVLFSPDRRISAEYREDVILEDGRTVMRRISLPGSLELGEYRIQVGATIGDTTISREATFLLKDRPIFVVGGLSATYRNMASGIGWFLIAGLIFFIVLLNREYRLAEKAVFQVTERFLKERRFIN